MNSLFIGLGGAGVYSVAEFAEKIRNYGSNQGNSFVYLDTDEKSLADFPFIRQDFIQLSGKDRNKGFSIENLIINSTRLASSPDIPAEIKKKHKQFLEWFDQDVVSSKELNKGAEGIRMLSRAILFADYSIIKQRIAQRMIYIDPADGQQKIRKIYVVSGTCGGTGSGIVIDILYMLNEIRRSQNLMAPQLPINLLLVMPQGYIMGTKDTSSLFETYRLNAYALIDELNACLKDYYGYCPDSSNAGMQMNKYRCCDNEVPPFQFDVFQNAFLFDSVTADGFDMSHEQRSENVANFLFTLEVGSQANAALDMHISNHIRTEKFNSAGAPFIKGFAATGMYVAQTWEELTRKYVRDKFMYQMLHYGFVGDGFVEDSVLRADTAVFLYRIHEIVDKAKMPIDGDSINNLLSKILARYGYEDLSEVLSRVKSSLAQKTQSVEAIFVNCNDEDAVRSLSKAVDSLLEAVRAETYRSCQDWVKRYNLRHALQLVQKLDSFNDSMYKSKIMDISEARIEKHFFKRTDRRREECFSQFEEYVWYLVCRNLSNEENGYLDECKRCLTAAINEINLLEYKWEGAKVEEWESNYIKYLNDLSKDNTRSVWPSLDNLYNERESCLVRNNDVERDYALLVRQATDGRTPELKFDLNQDKLLYTYKHRCFEDLASKNANWENFFVIGEGPSLFARNMKVAFEAFAEEVKKVGLELSKSNVLSKPFSQLALSAAEQGTITLTIDAFNRITVATQYQMDGAPSMEVVVADFNNMPWLQTALFPAWNNMLDRTLAQDDTMSDRIIKLYVEFGHALDDYRYYYDVYRPYFMGLYDSMSRSSRTRHHQPFIDKRFLTHRKPGESLAEMFAREACESCNEEERFLDAQTGIPADSFE